MPSRCLVILVLAVCSVTGFIVSTPHGHALLSQHPSKCSVGSVRTGVAVCQLFGRAAAAPAKGRQKVQKGGKKNAAASNSKQSIALNELPTAVKATVVGGLVAAPAGTAALLLTLTLSSATKTPFAFLDRFFPPAIEAKQQAQKLADDKAVQKAAQVAAEKAKAEQEAAAAKAIAEAAEKEAAAKVIQKQAAAQEPAAPKEAAPSTAAPKVAAPKVATPKVAAPKTAPSPVAPKVAAPKAAPAPVALKVPTEKTTAPKAAAPAASASAAKKRKANKIRVGPRPEERAYDDKRAGPKAKPVKPTVGREQYAGKPGFDAAGNPSFPGAEESFKKEQARNAAASKTAADRKAKITAAKMEQEARNAQNAERLQEQAVAADEKIKAAVAESEVREAKIKASKAARQQKQASAIATRAEEIARAKEQAAALAGKADVAARSEQAKAARAAEIAASKERVSMLSGLAGR